MLVKVTDATPIQLDWMVAHALGHLLPTVNRWGELTPTVVLDMNFLGDGNTPALRYNPIPDVYYEPTYSPSTMWAIGGPIIDRERITITQGRDVIASLWIEGSINADWYKLKHRADKPLTAAMRCFVASKLGAAVEVPNELA